MIAVAVNNLLCDAMRNLVAAVTGVWLSTSAKPNPFAHTSSWYAHRNARQTAIINLRANPTLEQSLLPGHIGVIRNARIDTRDRNEQNA